MFRGLLEIREIRNMFPRAIPQEIYASTDCYRGDSAKTFAVNSIKQAHSKRAKIYSDRTRLISTGLAFHKPQTYQTAISALIVAQTYSSH